MSADGKWTTTINTPMGAQNGEIDFSSDGNSLSGTLKAATGDTVDITDGTIDGDNLSWKAAITSPMPLTLEFSATIDGDSISGDVTLGPMGKATFTGQRA